MNCNECPMRYVCDTLLGGKDKCVYGECVPIVEGTSDCTEKETDNGSNQA